MVNYLLIPGKGADIFGSQNRKIFRSKFPCAVLPNATLPKTGARFLAAAFTLFALFAFPGTGLAEGRSIILQSTTSTVNSGLLDYLLPIFTSKTGIRVGVVSVGTGQALKNGRNGDGDVLLVHAREAEEKFVAEGYGVKRFDVMYNDFVIVGPKEDPAAISGSKTAARALQKIAQAGTAGGLFVSRGDNSGTHKRELALWKAAGIDPMEASGKWYRETGTGMGATLNIGVGMGGYVLTDRASWLSFRNKGGFRVMVEGDPLLLNQYGVIAVNPALHPRVKAKEAQAFIKWLTGPEGQKEIASFKLGGKQLFYPNAK